MYRKGSRGRGREGGEQECYCLILKEHRGIQSVTQLWEAEGLGRKEQLQYNLRCVQPPWPGRPQQCVQSKLSLKLHLEA